MKAMLPVGGVLALAWLAACHRQAEPPSPPSAEATSATSGETWGSSVPPADGAENPAPAESPAGAQEAVGPLGQQPGLWKLTRTLPQTEAPSVSQICIDAGQGQRLAMIGQDLVGKPDMAHLSCTRHGAADGVASLEADTVCTVNGVRLSSHIHADIISRKVFHQTVQTRYTPALAGHGEEITITDASWQGACPADMKPGDYVNPDGVRSSVSALLAKFR